MPIRNTTPNSRSHASRLRYPLGLVLNWAAPKNSPVALIAATACVSLCVSIPPMTLKLGAMAMRTSSVGFPCLEAPAEVRTRQQRDAVWTSSYEVTARQMHNGGKPAPDRQVNARTPWSIPTRVRSPRALPPSAILTIPTGSWQSDALSELVRVEDFPIGGADVFGIAPVR